MKREKELLRQQMKMLAEKSETAWDNELSRMTDAMVEIYKALIGTSLSRAVFLFSVFLDLVVCVLILVKYFFWS